MTANAPFRPSIVFINKKPIEITDDIHFSRIMTEDPIQFHKALPFYHPTSLFSLPGLAQKLGVKNIFIKDESSRFGLDAFKGLGAIYAMYKILEEHPEINTFVTATDGNHGRAVARAARYFDRRAFVYVPRDTSEQRINAISSEGAIVEKLDDNYDACCNYASLMAHQNGWQLIQDTVMSGFEEIPALITAGYRTIFQEVDAQLATDFDSAKIDLCLLQAGVGSFAGAGIAHYLAKKLTVKPQFVLVEPLEADAFVNSLQRGTLSTSVGNAQTIMAGLNCGTPSAGVWNLVRAGADAAIAIDDFFARQAIRELYFPDEKDTRIVAGESGAAGLAGLLALLQDENLRETREFLEIKNSKNILIINTEGITDEAMFHSIVGDKEYLR